MKWRTRGETTANQLADEHVLSVAVFPSFSATAGEQGS